jgi:hypothetical protein
MARVSKSGSDFGRRAASARRAAARMGRSNLTLSAIDQFQTVSVGLKKHENPQFSGFSVS